MKKWYKTGSIILAGLAILCLAEILYQRTGYFSPVRRAEQQEREKLQGEQRMEPKQNPADIADRKSREDAKEKYRSPIDFEKLQSVNPDIFGWLDIPGTNISYPLLQHKEDDTFYLNHNSDGQADPAGALFTEKNYNTTDFTDPAVVVYGHHMRSGALFGNLQQYYSEEKALLKYQEFLVYLPGKEIRYRVFAAVPYDSWHLLDGLDFRDKAQYQWFVDSVQKVRSVSAGWLEEEAPKAGERLLILSTCLSGNSQKRYLVIGKRITE